MSEFSIFKGLPKPRNDLDTSEKLAAAAEIAMKNVADLAMAGQEGFNVAIQKGSRGRISLLAHWSSQDKPLPTFTLIDRREFNEGYMLLGVGEPAEEEFPVEALVFKGDGAVQGLRRAFKGMVKEDELVVEDLSAALLASRFNFDLIDPPNKADARDVAAALSLIPKPAKK